MNRLTIFLIAVTGTTAISCRYHNSRTSITLSESDHPHAMKANFPYDRTDAVEQYMNEEIGEENNLSFANTKIDGRLSMDDHTTFYLKKVPAMLRSSWKRIKTHGLLMIKSKPCAKGRN